MSVFKVCLIGPATVGKTSLVRRLIGGQPGQEYVRTLGVAISKKEFRPDPSTAGEPVTLLLWDIMGDFDFFSEVAEGYLHGANGILAVLDVTRPQTLQGLSRWWRVTRDKVPRAVGVVAANKADLVSGRRVGSEDLKRLADETGWPNVETSALEGIGVEEAFHRLVGRLPQVL